MGKKKNKNKVSGAVKTAQKTEKKLAQKLKKELSKLGEEDIANVVAQLEQEEAKRAAPVEKALPGPPSARAYASLTPHPTNNELIMFGGEYHDGKKTFVYNDLLFYNPANNSWKQVKAPGAPPPRSAHQAVATPANKGELWVFGGEFTSLSETQFYHYKDLWCFSLSEKKWEKVLVKGGPTPRSGHRMILLGRSLFIFGGYADDGRECRYFDELYSFCLDTRLWTKIDPTGKGPSPRSACLLLPINNDSMLVYGGFSRAREGRSERALTHSDAFRLQRRSGAEWAWRGEAGGGAGARGGLAAALALNNRAYVFGGVYDVEETEEELRGEMCDTLLMLELESGKWHNVTLRTSAGPVATAAGDCEGGAPVEEKSEITVVTDDVFTMRLGGGAGAAGAAGAAGGGGARGGEGDSREGAGAAAAARGAPGGRMSAMMAVQRSQLYVYGGLLEKDEQQFYLSDMYSLDLHKLNEWKTLIKQPKLPDWLGSDSETESGSENESDSDSESDSE